MRQSDLDTVHDADCQYCTDFRENFVGDFHNLNEKISFYTLCTKREKFLCKIVLWSKK